MIARPVSLCLSVSWMTLGAQCHPTPFSPDGGGAGEERRGAGEEQGRSGGEEGRRGGEERRGGGEERERGGEGEEKEDK